MITEPSLTTVFGSGASQTATTITLQKADLFLLSANSSGQAVAVGLLKRWFLLAEGFIDSPIGLLKTKDGIPITYDQRGASAFYAEFWRMVYAGSLDQESIFEVKSWH